MSGISPPKPISPMKLTPDHPNLTALALGELDDADAQKMTKAVQADASLSKEYQQISAMAGLLGETLSSNELSLGADRREEILQSGRRPDADVLVMDHKKRSQRQSIFAVVGVAAVVVAGFIGLSKVGVDGPDTASGTSDAAGHSRGDGIPGDGVVTPSEDAVVNLPMNLGAALPAMVEESLAEKGTLPERDQFDVASWVNLVSLSQSPSVMVGRIDAYTELGSCPWNSDRDLLMVTLRSQDDGKVPVVAELDLDPNRVKSAVLVGGNETGAVVPASGGELEGARTWLYEVELILGNNKIGKVNLEAPNQRGELRSGYLPLAVDPSLNRDVSMDFKVARTLAGFARWGASEDREPGELKAIANASRDLLTEVKDGSTRYALDAILMAEEHLQNGN